MKLRIGSVQVSVERTKGRFRDLAVYTHTREVCADPPVYLGRELLRIGIDPFWCGFERVELAGSYLYAIGWIHVTVRSKRLRRRQADRRLRNRLMQGAAMDADGGMAHAWSLYHEARGETAPDAVLEYRRIRLVDVARGVETDCRPISNGPGRGHTDVWCADIHPDLPSDLSPVWSFREATCPECIRVVLPNRPVPDEVTE